MKNSNKTNSNLFSNIVVAIALLLSGSIINAASATEPVTVAHTTGGTVSYTMANGTDTIKRSLQLADDSYLYSADGESDIVIADPEARFHIGIVKKGTLDAHEVCKLAGIRPTTGIYILANYLKYINGKQLMEAIPFSNGYARVHSNDSGNCTVYFVCCVKDRATGKDIYVEGEAVFGANKMVMRN
jgi:hypothetical protein